MRDVERVLELEAIYPELVFTRHPEHIESKYAGQPVGWGMIPEQATGTLDGNPFYYRFRGNYGTLSVWDKSRFTVDSIPSSGVIPILSASVTDWVPGEDYAGATEGIALFKHLMDSLSAPTGLDTYPGLLSQSRAERDLPGASEVREVLQKVAPSITYPDREVEWSGAAELIFDVGGLGHVALRWGESFRDGVTVVLYAPSDDVVASGKAVGFSSYSVGEVTSENVVSNFFESWGELVWDHDASYSNHWDVSGLHMIATFSKNRPDLKERYDEEYGSWLKNVKESIAEINNFLASASVSD